DTPREKACRAEKKAFPHASHVDYVGSCVGCHTVVQRADASGKKTPEILRPAHEACLGCHSDAKQGPSFYEKDAGRRTICGECHVDRRDDQGKPVAGSYNQMTAAPGEIDYSRPEEKPCGITYGLEFSHSAHKGEDCSVCHRPLPD